IHNSQITNSNFKIISYDLLDPSQQLVDFSNFLQSLSEGSIDCGSIYIICDNESENSAEVITDLTVAADTCTNHLEAETTDLTTGDTTTVANFVQLTNSEIVNSNYFVVIINILVPWSGDIWLNVPTSTSADSSTPSQYAD